jgi:hypothetical protein
VPVAVQPALGTTIGCDFTTPSTYVTIGQVLNISVSGEVGTAETTHLGSTKKTFRPTLEDPGEINFEIEYDPSDTVSHTLLETLYAAKTIKGWQIAYVVGTPKVFQGFLTKLERTAGGPEENLGASFTVKLT